MPKVQVFAIEGFDEAIIGTAYRNGHEVLAYDGWAVEAILAGLGAKEGSLEEFLRMIRVHELGDQAPVFVYLGDDIVGDGHGSTERGPGSSVH